MGWFISEDRVPVEGIACLCPDTPHPDGDTVWLRKELTPDGALEAVGTFGEEDQEKKLAMAFLLNGLVDWTFLDEGGAKVPCTRENIRRLKWEVLWPIAQKASDLGYTDSLMRPLVPKASRSSRNGRMAASTSVPTSSGRSRRKQ